MPNRTSKITLLKIIKSLLEENIRMKNNLRDKDIIIYGLHQKLDIAEGRSKV